jgi:lipid II:glycine glycyltransferase (peptidoglycan interpeptide bridge formation enzyme)
MKNNRDEFIQKNSPCGGFLQSDNWIKFQADFGIKNHNISDRNFWSNILEYKLPLVGKYFYVPRGPVRDKNINQDELANVINDLIELAKINKAAWIRIDNFDNKIKNILKSKKNKVVKAPHDMQPKQIFIININKDEDYILNEMKPKTRYNIKLAMKKGVQIKLTEDLDNNEKIEKFLELVEKTGNRKGVNFHPRDYYRKMLKNISSDNLKLYLAVYNNKVIAGALLVIYGEIATYLHGASSDRDRNVMAPFLLQWEMIKEAKKMGATKYDFGGVSIDEYDEERGRKWAGVTRFKQGFSKETKPVEFSGSYDIIISPVRYWIYRWIQKMKAVL